MIIRPTSLFALHRKRSYAFIKSIASPITIFSLSARLAKEHSSARLIQKIPQFVTATGVAQFAKGLRLNLADAFPRDAEALPHLF